MLTKDSYRIILASQSPRRHQLLQQAGLNFVVKLQDVEEVFPDDLPIDEVAVYLAELKATAARSFLELPQDVILTADSVVILDGEIFGKPKDKADAQRILRRLSGREHRVITGVCLLTADQSIAFGDTAHVKFGDLSDEEIDYYIEEYQPFDKAGSYAIQEWIGLCKIERIQGTYANIMGLPVQRVYAALEELFNEV